jgi:hypothetical protein
MRKLLKNSVFQQQTVLIAKIKPKLMKRAQRNSSSSTKCQVYAWYSKKSSSTEKNIQKCHLVLNRPRNMLASRSNQFNCQSSAFDEYGRGIMPQLATNL